MKSKIRSQLIIIALSAILATVSLSSFVYYEINNKEVMNNLKIYTQLIADTDCWQVVSNPSSANERIVIHEEDQLRVTLIAPDGTAVYDSNASIDDMDNHSQRPEVASAFEKGDGQAIRDSKTLSKNTYYYAKLLNNGYVLRVAKEAGNVISVLFTAIPVMILLCVLLVVVSIIASYMLTQNIVEPIEHMAQNLDASDSIQIYKELEPFVATIRRQHEDIIKNANIRQEFTANVSHELKTPLTSISGYSELIESGMANEEDTVRFAQEIHKNAKRLLTLINDIIRLSQLDQDVQEDPFEEVNLYEVAENCLDILKMSAQNHNVLLELHGSSQYVYGNKRMLEELIYNLIDNAIRYNNPQGSVDVTIDNKEGNVIVEVKDTGIGIPKEHQERIFERFYRVDKSRSKSTGGTGLGLAIVKHIIAKHKNACMELISEEGKGTTIRVIFQSKLGKGYISDAKQ
jgi:two-component system phosphate regulon sensor histidine kinase PhoR